MEIKEKKVIAVRPIPGYERLYSATSDGRIYCHPRRGVKACFVKIRSNTEYARIPLWKDGVRTWHHVHRLVASAFLPNLLNKPQVNHKNCNKHDNSVDNLEWATKKENWDHARDHGKYRGIMLSEEDQLELYGLYRTGLFTRNRLAKIFSISLSTVDRHIKKHREMRQAA
jgi:hypothetical protein